MNNALHIEVCKHRHGKQMTYTEQTDGVKYFVSYQSIRDLLANYNLKGGIFLSLEDLRSGYMSVVLEDEKTIWLDQYSSIYPSALEIILSKLHLMRKNKIILRQYWELYYAEELLSSFQKATGRKPVALSYSYGNDSFKDYLTTYLGARNSGVSGNTSYGTGCGNRQEPYQQERFRSRESTIRWYDSAVASIRANHQVGGGKSLIAG